MYIILKLFTSDQLKKMIELRHHLGDFGFCFELYDDVFFVHLKPYLQLWLLIQQLEHMDEESWN